MGAYWKTVWILFGIFVAANAAFLHSVPGLMGDEASEGENVYELLQSEKFVVQGERSYIGPLIDYARVPFILGFGYTPLALRLVVVLASFAAFWLAACVFLRAFGAESGGQAQALFALVFGFFNPIYLTQERIGWAIALFPFFFFLILWLLGEPAFPKASASRPVRVLLAGFAAGIALSNHILFLPTLTAVVVAGTLVLWLRKALSVGRKVLSTLLAFAGFAAGFALQLWVLLSFREDQGDVVEVAQSFWERLADLPRLLPLVLSGSSYVARYTGVEFAPAVVWVVTAVIALLGLAAVLLVRPRKVVLLWLLGMIIHLAVLLYMIDRFTLRYFVMFVIAAWMLAGVGLGTLIESFPTLRSGSVKWGIPILFSIVLVGWSAFVVLIPFLKTGGSTADFSLGNRTDSAAALVDTRPLIECLRGAGPVSSENVHIWNRLQFLSHGYSDLKVVPQDDSSHAEWLVHYRDAKQPDPGDLCPELAHFQVVAN